MDLAQRPPYHTVDFKTLARNNPAFQPLWQSASGKLNFQDPETIKTLSRTILQSDFGLQLEVPDDRLCPPIPNRWNYVSWIQGLIDSTSPTYSNGYQPDREITGLDIGTGASAIYTMLCLRSRPNWTMCATDIDKQSFDSAARNLAINNLMTRTKLLQSTFSTPLIPLQALAAEKLDFTICNPPFFADDAEMRASLQGDRKTCKPNAVCTGAPVEMICPGGDLGFVTQLVQESLVLREKVTWYTSMLGKLDSAKAILSLLKHHGISNRAVGVIDPGAATKRWTVAWSFTDWRPRNNIARPPNLPNEYLPFPTHYIIPLPPSMSASAATEVLTKYLASLDLKWTWDASSATGIGEASQNVWSRGYRRAYERRLKEGEILPTQEERKVSFVFRVRMVELAREVVVEWVKGLDRVVWESLCGVLHRHVQKR